MAIVAALVLGGCNAANLIDGLDGLLSGTTAIIGGGLLIISLLLALHLTGSDLAKLESTLPTAVVESEGLTLAGARIALCMALIGASIGFLAFNFNPAMIFLGDAGSLLIGYFCVTIILTLGELGQTHFVVAGLIVFGLPIVDTVLAITRRKSAGAACIHGGCESPSPHLVTSTWHRQTSGARHVGNRDGACNDRRGRGGNVGGRSGQGLGDVSRLHRDLRSRRHCWRLDGTSAAA